MNENTNTRRSAVSVMGRLITLIRPLVPVMLIAIVFGVAGFLCAIFLTITAAYTLLRALLEALGADLSSASLNVFLSMSVGKAALVLIILAVLRGILHYAEQYCNHFIAFKLLAIIRNKVFKALRNLAPAKLEGKDRGNLIALITSDIELLEVFYAHTVSPIAIAVITSVIMVCFIGSLSAAAGVIALAGYVLVGAVLPIYNGKRGAADGMELRSGFGELNSFVLDSLRGIDETIQYGCTDEGLNQINERSMGLGELQRKLNRHEASQRSLTTLLILAFSFIMLFVMINSYVSGGASFESVLISTVAMMGSFGPVVALSNLSNNLNQTLASGERVLRILEEEPETKEITGKAKADFGDVSIEGVDFSYDSEEILKNFDMKIPKDKITGIHGASGSGKSTLLKLLMRFYDADAGSISIDECSIKEINTAELRKMQSYVLQDTVLFNDTIAANIAIGRLDASREEIIEAAKAAAIHDFIMSLPKGYDTRVGELGDALSGGERQRIGIARAFLHNAPMLLLDEPTSNLDSLNEGIILKSLKERATDRTVVLVSHRRSTMNLADIVYETDKSN